MGKSPFISMLRQEIALTKQYESRLLAKNIEAAATEGDILGPVRLTDKPGTRNGLLEFRGFYTRFRAGDKVDLRVRRGRAHELITKALEIKNVIFPEVGRIQFEVVARDVLNRRDEYFIYENLDTLFDKKLIECVDKARNCDFYDGRFAQDNSHLLLQGIEDNLETLNSTQIEALRYLLSQNLEGCVQGPPGTGKTYLVNAIIDIAMQSGLVVGLAAFTHSALDNALSRFIKGRNSEDYVRVGKPLKIRKELYENAVAPLNVASFSKAPGGVQLYVATSHSWVLSPTAPNVDLLIVDEAGQVPAYMAPMLRRLADRIICVGDHKQLPPVLRGDSYQVPTDMFSLEMGLYGYTPMLEVQYRMNQWIQDWSSQRYYKGLLRPFESNVDRDILRAAGDRGLRIGTSPVQLVSHSKQSTGHHNEFEASAVANLVSLLCEQGGLDKSKVGIISPHRIQAGAIMQKLQETYGPEVCREIAIDTVERFQGQEKEVILLSFGSEKDGNRLKGLDVFLGDPRRLNVSVTRARSRFYCLASNRLRREKSELADFLAWCETQQKEKLTALNKVA